MTSTVTTTVTTRYVETNGIKLHVQEAVGVESAGGGKRPLVILLHGFPEIGYTWRHQVPALAEAGYRVVVPDQRGYGLSDAPPNIEDYDMFNLVADIVGLVHALGEESAVLVGHDYGGDVASQCALMRPDLFHAVVLMSFPYRARQWGSMKPIELFDALTGKDMVMYISYFQEPGKAERDLQANVRESVLGYFYTVSAEVAPEHQWRFIFSRDESFFDTMHVPEKVPQYLTEADIDVYTQAFERTGYGPALNWYRNYNRNWELTPHFSEAKIQQPALFITGEKDDVLLMIGEDGVANMEDNFANLQGKHLIPGAGHCVVEEKPDEVTALLLEFLSQNA